MIREPAPGKVLFFENILLARPDGSESLIPWSSVRSVISITKAEPSIKAWIERTSPPGLNAGVSERLCFQNFRGVP
ncbi:MAG TPA: hypothetical protein PKG48_02360 [Bacteroidales bacterium]|nr:hypothetical protein [Bacteroidales bacterium]HPS61646.1 hypothetical protein [Bacteroidales bacterium]